MEEEAWMVLLRQQTGEAAGRCARARGKLQSLALVLANLRTQELVSDADAAAWSSWTKQRAERMLVDASRGLADGASLMAEVGILALCFATVSPSSTLRSIGDGEALRLGVAQLQLARDRAEKACLAVGLCRAYLRAFGRLLGHMHLPGVESLLDVNLAAARRDLDAARMLAQNSVSLACNTLVRLL